MQNYQKTSRKSHDSLLGIQIPETTPLGTTRKTYISNNAAIKPKFSFFW